jgi:hypothetical protein
MCAAVGWEWQKDENVKAMAKSAVDEGLIGVYEDKINKIRGKVRHHQRFQRCEDLWPGKRR